MYTQLVCSLLFSSLHLVTHIDVAVFQLYFHFLLSFFTQHKNFFYSFYAPCAFILFADLFASKHFTKVTIDDPKKLRRIFQKKNSEVKIFWQKIELFIFAERALSIWNPWLQHQFLLWDTKNSIHWIHVPMIIQTH